MAPVMTDIAEEPSLSITAVDDSATVPAMLPDEVTNAPPMALSTAGDPVFLNPSVAGPADATAMVPTEVVHPVDPGPSASGTAEDPTLTPLTGEAAEVAANLPLAAVDLMPLVPDTAVVAEGSAGRGAGQALSTDAVVTPQAGRSTDAADAAAMAAARAVDAANTAPQPLARGAVVPVKVTPRKGLKNLIMKISCSLLGHARLDPIISPGRTSDHVHAFFGAMSVGNTIDLENDFKSTVQTSCVLAEDIRCRTTAVLSRP